MWQRISSSSSASRLALLKSAATREIAIHSQLISNSSRTGQRPGDNADYSLSRPAGPLSRAECLLLGLSYRPLLDFNRSIQSLYVGNQQESYDAVIPISDERRIERKSAGN